jgi:hypothetical protein
MEGGQGGEAARQIERQERREFFLFLCQSSDGRRTVLQLEQLPVLARRVDILTAVGRLQEGTHDRHQRHHAQRHQLEPVARPVLGGLLAHSLVAAARAADGAAADDRCRRRSARQVLLARVQTQLLQLFLGGVQLLQNQSKYCF